MATKREAYVALAKFAADAIEYCGRQGLLSDDLAPQIDLLCTEQGQLRSAGAGLYAGSLNAPNGGKESLLAVADAHFFVCAAIVAKGTESSDDQLSDVLDDVSVREKLNAAYGMLIRLRSFGLT